MAANFSKRTNNNDVKGSPFNKVIFGGDAAVMETELNELQDLIGRNIEILTMMIGKTFILRSHSYGGDEIRDRLSSTNTNGDLVFDTNGIDTYIVCNGGKYVISISDILFDEVESKDITDGCIYIKNVTYTKDDDGNIVYSGYKNGKLLNVYSVLGKSTGKLNANIFDSRINQETTRREGFIWWFGEATETEPYDVKVEGLTFDYLKKSTSNPYGSLVIKCPVISGNGLLSIINNMDYHNNKDQLSIGIGVNTNKNGTWTNGPSYDSVAIGYNAVSDYGSHDSVVIGYNSHAGNYEANINAPNSVVVGTSSRTTGPNSIAIGAGDRAENNGIAIGINATAINGIAIGSKIKVNDVESEPLVVGNVARNSSSIFIGERTGANFINGNSQLPVERTILIGSYARPVANVANGIATNVIAVGHLASGNNESITVGVNAISGVNSVTIGHNANTYANSIAIGTNAHSVEIGSIAVGYNTTSKGAIAIGNNSNIVDTEGFGHGNLSVNELNMYSSNKSIKSIAIGDNAGVHLNANINNTVAVARSILIGSYTRGVTNDVANFPVVNSISIGHMAMSANDAIAIGIGAKAMTNSIVIGTKSESGGVFKYLGSDNVVIGYNASANSRLDDEYCVNCVVVGSNTHASFKSDNTVVIGAGINSQICHNSVLIGSGIGMNSGTSRAVAIGYNVNLSASSDDVLVGNRIDTSNSRIIGIGYNIGAIASEGSILIGYNSKINGVYPNMFSSNNIAVMRNGFIDAKSIENVLYGSNISINTLLGGSMTDHVNANNNTLIGCGINTANISYSTVLGYHNEIKNAKQSIAIGVNSRVSGYDSSSMYATYSAISIGYNSYTSTANGIAIGHNVIATGKSGSSPSSAPTMSIAIGNNLKSIDGIYIGDDISTQLNNSIFIGRKPTLYSSKKSDGIFVGDNITIKNSPFQAGVAIGHNIVLDSKTESTYSYDVVAIGGDAKINDRASIAIGEMASVNGKQSIAIGYGASCNREGSISFANMSFDECNAISLGDYSIAKLLCKVSLTVFSDERDKYILGNIEGNATEFLKRLHPIRYNRNDRELYRYHEDDIEAGNITQEEYNELEEKRNIPNVKYYYGYNKAAHTAGTNKGERVRVGLSAQEIVQAMEDVYGDDSYVNLVDDDTHDLTAEERAALPEDAESRLTVAYENFIPFLIKSIQELSSRLDDAESVINKLKIDTNEDVWVKSTSQVILEGVYSTDAPKPTSNISPLLAGMGENTVVSHRITATMYTYNNGDVIYVGSLEDYFGPVRKRINGERYDAMIYPDGIVWNYNSSTYDGYGNGVS